MTDIPEEIPKDIEDAADEVVDASWDGDQYVFLTNHIERAILAERKRCAEVARRFVGYTESPAGSVHSAESKKLVEDAADWIATSIMHPTL